MMGWRAALVGSLWLSSVAAVQASSLGTGRGPVSEGRLFAPLRAAATWLQVQARLKELGLSTDKVDRAHQLVITNWRGVDAKGMDWLRLPPLPDAWRAERVRFEIFVSPFAEPARVYVGSILEVSERGGSGGRATTYNLAEVNRGLMAEIGRALGTEGVSIPTEAEVRHQFALAALGEEADDCLRRAPLKGGQMTSPAKIPASEFQVLYPAGSLQERKAGTVTVMFTVREDGGVADVHLEDVGRGDPFEASAMGAASLLFYSPGRIDGCPVPAFVTYTVRYRR